MDLLLKEYQSLYDHLPDMLLSADQATGNVVKCNKAFFLKTGFSQNEIAGQAIPALLDIRSADEELALWRLLNTDKIPGGLRLRLKRKRRGAIPVQVILYRSFNGEHSSGKFHIMLKELRENEENHLQLTIKALEKKMQQLRSKNGQLEEYAHITSHNLHSHIINLNSLLSFYTRSDDESEKEELLDKLKSLSAHLLDTVEELAETMVIRPSEEILMKEISFDSCFRKTLDILSGQIMESDAEISADFYDCERIRYYPPYLESIMLNLLSNAIKYRSPERKCIVEVRTYEDNGEKNLEVKDNGLGIDMSKNGKKIFRLHKVFHHNKDARGVGLFLTKSHVEALGGAISVESRPNEGSLFRVVFNKK